MKKILLVALLFPFAALAADADYVLTIRDHRFQPSELTIEAGKRISVLIENQDDTQEEFESHALNREKTIAAHGRITLYIGPLEPGRYPFAGERHEDTAQGVIIVR